MLPIRFSNLVPIDLAYLSAYLKNRGHHVYVKDFNAECPAKNDSDSVYWSIERNQIDFLEKKKSMIEKFSEEVLDFSPDVVGMSVWDAQRVFSLAMASMLKRQKQDIKVVFGGPTCSYWQRGREWIKDEFVDCVISGEGEVTFAEFIETKVAGTKALPGCIIKNDDRIIFGGWRKEIEDLDSIPFPDYSQFSFDKYLLFNTYPIVLTRGCGWNCSFCTSRTVWRKLRSRSPENVFAEIKYCLQKYSINKFFSCDHSTNSDMNLLSRLCDLILEHGVEIEEISAFGQVKPGMTDKKFLEKLKKAGFTSWGIGIQSGSDRVLRSMRRPHTSEMIEQTLKAIHESGIKLFVDFIVGYPTETEKDFKQTLEFVSKIVGYIENISVMPYCDIGANDLQFHPERYGIYALNTGSNSWESESCTPAIREKRYQIFQEHLLSLGISNRRSEQDRVYMELRMQGLNPR